MDITANDQALMPFWRNRKGRAAAVTHANTTLYVPLQSGRSHVTGIGWLRSHSAGKSASNRYKTRSPLTDHRFRVRSLRDSLLDAGVSPSWMLRSCGVNIN